ncbi:MAG: hypothetical protein FJY29_04160 [Betaproteobacteria bacterium]|nr:hypothetical protein [Betaproteobacteria bacterium]
MKRLASATLCLFALTLPQCVKKMGSQAIGNVYSCSVRKGETLQSCSEFKNIAPNEVTYFKQKCDSDSSMDVAAWKEVGCAVEARQGGCSLNFADATSNISTSFVTWGYTATGFAAVTTSDACEKVGGKVVTP